MSPQPRPEPAPEAPPAFQVQLGYDPARQTLSLLMFNIPPPPYLLPKPSLTLRWEELEEGDTTGKKTWTAILEGAIEHDKLCDLAAFASTTEVSGGNSLKIGTATARVMFSSYGEYPAAKSNEVTITVTPELLSAIQRAKARVAETAHLDQPAYRRYGIPLMTRLKIGRWRLKRWFKKKLKSKSKTQPIETQTSGIKPPTTTEITETKETIMSTPIKVSKLSMASSILSWDPMPGKTFQVTITSHASPPEEILKQGGMTANSLDIAKIPACSKMDKAQTYSVFVTVEGQAVSEHLEIKAAPTPAPVKVENLVVDETSLQAMWNPMPGKEFAVTVIHTTGSRKVIDGAPVTRNYINLGGLTGGDQIVHGGSYEVQVQVKGETEAAKCSFVSAKPNPTPAPTPTPTPGTSPKKKFWTKIAEWAREHDAGMKKLANNLAILLVILVMIALSGWGIKKFLDRHQGSASTNVASGKRIPVGDGMNSTNIMPTLTSGLGTHGTTNSPSVTKAPGTAPTVAGHTNNPVHVEGMQPIVTIGNIESSTNVSIKIEITDKSRRGTIQPDAPTPQPTVQRTRTSAVLMKTSVLQATPEESEWLKRQPNYEGKITPNQSKRVGECDRIVLRIEPGQIHRYWNAPGWATIPTPDVPHCDYRYAIDDEEDTADMGMKKGYTFSYFNVSSEPMYVTLTCTKMEETNPFSNDMEVYGSGQSLSQVNR